MEWSVLVRLALQRPFFAILEDKLSGAGQFGVKYLSEKGKILGPLRVIHDIHERDLGPDTQFVLSG